MSYAVAAANLFGIKKCKYISRVGSIITSNLNEMGIVRRFIMTCYQKVLYFSDIIITQSHAMDLDLQNYVKRNSRIIYNPIFSEKILELSKEVSPYELEDKYFNIICR